MPTAAHDVLRVRCVLQCTRTSGTNCFIYARMSLIRNATLPTSLTPQDARDAVACLTELGGPSHVCPAETTSQCGRQSFRLSWMCGSPGTHAPPRPARTTATSAPKAVPTAPGPTADITVQFADLHLFGSVSVFDSRSSTSGPRPPSVRALCASVARRARTNACTYAHESFRCERNARRFYSR